MDIIDKFIKKNKHITKNSIILNKTWNDFNDACQSKKIIIYGVSEITNLIWIRDINNIDIITAIDNNIEKQGHMLCEFFDERNLKEAQNIKIESKLSLERYNPNEVIILISTLSHYEEISEELDKQNFNHYFSILNMEFYYRECMKQNGLGYETIDDYKQNYVQNLIKKCYINQKKIVFYNLRMGYSDHGKYIINHLLTMNKDLDLVWISSDISINVPNGVRIVYYQKWQQVAYEMESANIWVFHDPMPNYILKQKNQIYIQTKHWGSITLKKFYLDTPLISHIGNREYYWRLNGELIDYIISGSELDESSCRSGFNFNGKFLRFGSPRSDALFDINVFKRKIYDIFNITDGEHILLYVPTFRHKDIKSNNLSCEYEHSLEFDNLLKILKYKWAGNWKIFLRLHPNTKSKSKNIKKPNYVIDVSDYDDSQELVAAADVMISDYSSIMFEAAYIFKPVFLYAPDKEEYVKNERNFLIDYRSLPFPISVTNEGLSEQIKNFDENKYKENVRVFLEKYGVHEDGHASERTAKFIIKLLSGEVETYA